MAWGLIISFAVGVLCALRVPILHFTIIVLIVMVGYALANIGSGNSAINIIGWSFILAAVLEAGYIFPHVIFYVVYVKLLGRDLGRSGSQTGSRFFAHDLFHGHSAERLAAKAESASVDKAGRGIQD